MNNMYRGRTRFAAWLFLLAAIAFTCYAAWGEAIETARLRVVSAHVLSIVPRSPSEVESGQIVLVAGILTLDEPIGLPAGDPSFANVFKVERETERYNRWARHPWSRVEQSSWAAPRARIESWHVTPRVLRNDRGDGHPAQAFVDYTPPSGWYGDRGDRYIYQEISSVRFRRQYSIWPAGSAYTVVARVGEPTTELVTMDTGVIPNEQFAVMRAGSHADVGYIGDLIEHTMLRGIVFLILFFLLVWIAMALNLRRQRERSLESIATASLGRAAISVSPLILIYLFAVPAFVALEGAIAAVVALLLAAGFLIHARYIQQPT